MKRGFAIHECSQVRVHIFYAVSLVCDVGLSHQAEDYLVSSFFTKQILPLDLHSSATLLRQGELVFESHDFD